MATSHEVSILYIVVHVHVHFSLSAAKEAEAWSLEGGRAGGGDLQEGSLLLSRQPYRSPPIFLDSVEHFDGFVAVGFAAFGEWVWFLLTPPSCGHTDWRTGAEATKRYFND